MLITYFPKQCSNAGKPILDKFIRSVSKTDMVSPNNLKADVAVIWSVLWKGRMEDNWAVYQHFQKRNKPVIILETGNLLRGKSFKVSIGHLDRSGVYAMPDVLDPQRIDLFSSAVRKVNRGKYVLLCGQQDSSLLWGDAPPLLDWFEQCITNIREHSDRPIIIRPHPRQQLTNYNKLLLKYGNVIYKAPTTNRLTDKTDFQQILKLAWCVVGHNSGSLIEAAAKHIPVFCHPSSLCYPISNGELSNIEKAESKTNQDWLNYIVHTEWFEHEILSGIPWHNIRDSYLLNMVT